MIERGEDLALAGEARVEEVAVDGGAHHLDRDLLAIPIVDADAEEDGAHAAAADLAHHFVGADAAAEDVGRGVVEAGDSGAALEERPGGVVGRQQAVDVVPQRRIAGGAGVEARLPVGPGREADDLVEDGANPMLPVGIHGVLRHVILPRPMRGRNPSWLRLPTPRHRTPS